MYTIVDTSVWIEFLRHGDKNLDQILQENKVGIHPFVLTELQCGQIKNRLKFVSDLKLLPTTPMVSNDFLSELIERHQLFGKGLSAIDVHLLASALYFGHELYTLDKALKKVASRFPKLRTL
jgi:predicted nucleic acid-binding protein